MNPWGSRTLVLEVRVRERGLDPALIVAAHSTLPPLKPGCRTQCTSLGVCSCEHVVC